MQSNGATSRSTLPASFTVLLVDDDVELCELLAEYLQPEGFDVEAVHSGDAALERALEADFHVIVLDVMLPKLGGLEVLRALRARRATPVLMLTARGDDVERIIGLELGADDYLPKPCNPRELVARLRAIVRRAYPHAHGGTSAAIEIGDLSLNPATRSVRCGTEAVSLTGTEFNILEALLRTSGQVVDKQKLSRQGLGRALTRFDRSLDVHVSNLRRKLGAHPDGSPRIRTVRGIGYIYTAPVDVRAT